MFFTEDTTKRETKNITRDQGVGGQILEAEKQYGVTFTVKATGNILITFFLGSNGTVGCH